MKYASAHRLFLLSTAPFLGVLCWLVFATVHISMPAMKKPELENVSVATQAEAMTESWSRARESIQIIGNKLENYFALYHKSTKVANELVYQSSLYVDKPLEIYDRRITQRLGTPIEHVASKRLDLKLFRLVEDTYNGYAMKVHVKDKSAMNMVLGDDRLGGSETTMQAVKRTSAVAGINAGGFADDWRTGDRYPLSTTMVKGEYLFGFAPSRKDLFFVGLSEDLQLIGGEFERKQQLDSLHPLFGASFVPVLMKNGQALEIPSKWLTSPRRAARTVIGDYKHDHLLVMVTNGSDGSGKSGATLPELQEKLNELGVMDAYNLDGGGSSSLVFKGKVLNQPSDGKLRNLPTHFLFFK